MQYLLTKEEYNNLKPVKEVENRDQIIDILRKNLLKASNYTCIHDYVRPEYGYCDGCPCLKITSYEQYSIVCKLKKDFSQ